MPLCVVVTKQSDGTGERTLLSYSDEDSLGSFVRRCVYMGFVDDARSIDRVILYDNPEVLWTGNGRRVRT